MILTDELLRSVATNGYSGWNRKQLELLGVNWPPKSGWLYRLCGTEIPDDRWEVIKQLRGARLSKKKNRHQAPSESMTPKELQRILNSH